MAQADSHNSTRRAFLSTTAGAAAAAALAPAALASTQADPTFALIEAHRAAEAAHVTACAEYSRREQVLIDEGIGHHPFVTMIIIGGAPIVAYGHPHIDAYWGCASEQVRAKAHADLDRAKGGHDEIMGNSEDEAGRLGDVAADALNELIFSVPTTAHGARALLDYLLDEVADLGQQFHDEDRLIALLSSVNETLQTLHPAAA